MEYRRERHWLEEVQAGARAGATDAEYDFLVREIESRRLLWEEGVLNQFLNPIDHRRLTELADHSVRHLRSLQTGS